MSIKISCLQCFWVRKVHHQNYDDWKLIPMHFINNAFKKDFIFIQILVSKLLYCISFLLFTLTFFIHGKETFLISLTLLVVQDTNFYSLTIMLQLITVLLTLKDLGVTILTLSISYLHLRENLKSLKSGIGLKEKFNTLIIYITNLHRVDTQLSKSANKYKDKTVQVCTIY